MGKENSQVIPCWHIEDVWVESSEQVPHTVLQQNGPHWSLFVNPVLSGRANITEAFL